MVDKEAYELLKKIPGIVWKKSENYQKAYKLEFFDVPQEWLDMVEKDEAAWEPKEITGM